MLDSKKADTISNMLGRFLRTAPWSWAIVACSLVLWAPISTPWLHEHDGAYLHDHGTGVIHAHWGPESHDQPLIQAPQSKNETRYCDWIQLDKSPTVFLSQIDIDDQHGVDLQCNSQPLARITSPWAHGPPWLAKGSLRSPLA